MSRTPVIFVPGIFGSFNLPVLLDWRGPTLSGWDFPPFVDYGKNFVKAFQNAGYTRDRDLFIAFYDWRKSVKDTALSYLMPWIDRAKSRSGSAKVVLVGHSMGGLVSRSYIQSSSYRGDVERLITLGTPHRGSPESYYAWGGGEVKSEGFAKVVFDVYLWYLEHANPLSSQMDRLRTVRTLIPAVRDLLPIDDYLIDQEAPARRKPEDLMRERNLWVEVLNQPAGLNTLFGRVPVTTISAKDFITLEALVVSGPAEPPGEPPRYPDGVPVDDRTDGNGDGTVPLVSAQLNDGRAHNLPSVAVRHAELPDGKPALEQLFTALQAPLPALPAAQPPQPRLLILSASPVELSVEFQEPTPLGVAEAGRPARAPRRRTIKAKNYGHSGKHLNLLIIPDPDPNTAYNVRVQGTATGTFALGTLIVGTPEAGVLGTAAAGEGLPAPFTATGTTTVEGKVAAATDLRYEVRCPSLTAQPELRFDAAATAQNLLERLGAAVQNPPVGVLGMAETPPAAQVSDVLGAAPEAVRDSVSAALSSGDAAATQDVATMLRDSAQQASAASALLRVTRDVLSPMDTTLAAGLMEQLKQIVEQG